MVSNQYVAVNIGSEVLRPVEHHVVQTGTEIYVISKMKTKCDGVYVVFV